MEIDLPDEESTDISLTEEENLFVDSQKYGSAKRKPYSYGSDPYYRDDGDESDDEYYELKATDELPDLYVEVKRTCIPAQEDAMKFWLEQHELHINFWNKRKLMKQNKAVDLVILDNQINRYHGTRNTKNKQGQEYMRSEECMTGVGDSDAKIVLLFRCPAWIEKDQDSYFQSIENRFAYDHCKSLFEENKFYATYFFPLFDGKDSLAIDVTFKQTMIFYFLKRIEIIAPKILIVVGKNLMEAVADVSGIRKDYPNLKLYKSDPYQQLVRKGFKENGKKDKKNYFGSCKLQSLESIIYCPQLYDESIMANSANKETLKPEMLPSWGEFKFIIDKIHSYFDSIPKNIHQLIKENGNEPKKSSASANNSTSHAKPVKPAKKSNSKSKRKIEEKKAIKTSNEIEFKSSADSNETSVLGIKKKKKEVKYVDMKQTVVTTVQEQVVYPKIEIKERPPEPAFDPFAKMKFDQELCKLELSSENIKKQHLAEDDIIQRKEIIDLAHEMVKYDRLYDIDKYRLTSYPETVIISDIPLSELLENYVVFHEDQNTHVAKRARPPNARYSLYYMRIIEDEIKRRYGTKPRDTEEIKFSDKTDAETMEVLDGWKDTKFIEYDKSLEYINLLASVKTIDNLSKYSCYLTSKSRGVLKKLDEYKTVLNNRMDQDEWEKEK